MFMLCRSVFRQCAHPWNVIVVAAILLAYRLILELVDSGTQIVN